MNSSTPAQGEQRLDIEDASRHYRQFCEGARFETVLADEARSSTWTVSIGSMRLDAKNGIDDAAILDSLA
jgi:hypothetical protein